MILGLMEKSGSKDTGFLLKWHLTMPPRKKLKASFVRLKESVKLRMVADVPLGAFCEVLILRPLLH